MRWLLLLAFLALQPACPKPTPTPVGPTPDASDAAPQPVADCSAACTNESRLGCPAAATCLALCPTQLRNNSPYVLCVAAATSCRGIDACDTAPAGTGKPTGPGGSRSGP